MKKDSHGVKAFNSLFVVSMFCILPYFSKFLNYQTFVSIVVQYNIISHSWMYSIACIAMREVLFGYTLLLWSGRPSPILEIFFLQKGLWKKLGVSMVLSLALEKILFTMLFG
jgi:hypothetical protein